MTHRSRQPTRHNRKHHTAYERSNRNRRRSHFGYDAHSCMHGAGIWPCYVSDVEDLTILSGLENRG